MRLTDGRYEVYAPAGFADVFGFVLRPNPVVAPPVGVRDQGRPLGRAVAPPPRPAVAARDGEAMGSV